MDGNEVLETETTDVAESEENLDLGFDDEAEVVEDSPEATDVETETQANEEDVQQEQTETPAGIKVEFNHQEMEIPLDQARAWIQKGMNYDNVQEQLQNVQNSSGMQYLLELSQRSGMTIDEMVDYWRGQEEQQQINELVQKNIPPEYAKEMIENRKFREAQKIKEQQSQKEEANQKEYRDFVQAYPDVQAEDIPEDVWSKVNNGVPLKYAYMEYENSQLKEKNKIQETNISNKKKAVVKGVSGTPMDEKYDPFLAGFDGED